MAIAKKTPAKRAAAPKTLKRGDKVRVRRRDGSTNTATFLKSEPIKTGTLLHVVLKDGTVLKMRPAQVKR